MTIQGKGRRVDNFESQQPKRGSALRTTGVQNVSESAGIAAALSMTNSDYIGRGDIAFGPGDVLLYVFSAASDSSYTSAKVYAMHSYDYGKTWSDPVVVFEEVDYAYKDPYLYYNYEAQNFILSCTKVSDIDSEDSDIVIAKSADMFETSPNLSTVTQPYTLKNVTGGGIKKVSRYLFIPVYGYESTGGDNTPGYLRSQDAGDSWTIHVELSGTGKARNVYACHDNARIDTARSTIFVMVESDTSDAKGVLHASVNQTDWIAYNLPFVLKNSCDYVDHGGVKTFFTQDRSSLGWNEYVFQTINGYDFTPAETIGGAIDSFRKLSVSKSGAVFCAYNIWSQKSSFGDQIGLQEIILPDKEEVKNDISPQIEIAPRNTTIADTETFESRSIRTDRPSIRLFLQGNSTPSGLENIKIELKYGYTTSLEDTVDITHLFSLNGRVIKADVDLEHGYFQVNITNNTGASKLFAMYGDLRPEFGFRAGKQDPERSQAVTLDKKFEGANPAPGGLGKIVNISKTGGFYDYSGNKSMIGFSCAEMGPDGNIYLLYRSGDTHGTASGAQLYMVKSEDFGRSWGVPVLMVDAAVDYDYRAIFFSYDFASDRYFMMYSIQNADYSTSNVTVRYCDGQKDPMDISNYNTSSAIPKPFTERNVGMFIYRRGKDNLIMTYWGGDTGDSDNHPAILYSQDNGENWAVGNTFPDLVCNESAYYWKHNQADDSAQHFMICRPEPESKDAQIITGEHPWFDTGYTVHSANIHVAGGHYVQDIGGYFCIVGRNAQDSASDSSGFFAYSIDGLNWSETEFNSLLYPVQPHFIKTHTGRLLIQGCVQPSDSNTIGYNYIAEFVPPNFLEVAERLKGLDLHVFERYTSIAATANYETYYIKCQGLFLDIRFQRNNSFGDLDTGSGISVSVIYPLKLGAEQAQDVTDQLTVTAGNCIGRVAIHGQYAKIKVTNNTGAEIRIQGFVRSL
jgi:hypothetical protein